MYRSPRLYDLLGPSSLEGCRVLFVIGPGGVGKTTAAARIALEAALKGRRTLVCTVDPARRLATSLGLSGPATEPVPVPAESLAASGLPSSLPLHSALLDVPAVMDAFLLAEVSDPKRRQRIRENPFYRLLAHDLEGSQSYAAMVSIVEYAESGNWEFLVVDTPPTSHARELFESPYRLAHAAGSPILKWLASPKSWTGRLGLSLLGLGRRRLLRRAARILGGRFLDELADFVALVADLVPILEARSEHSNRLLRNRDTAFLLATTLDKDRVGELAVTYEYLRAQDTNILGLVASRALPSPEPIPPWTGTIESAACVREADRLYRSWWQDEQSVARLLAENFPQLPGVVLELSPDDVSNLSALLALRASRLALSPEGRN